MEEIDLSHYAGLPPDSHSNDNFVRLMYAILDARNQGQGTWITVDGQRIAKILPPGTPASEPDGKPVRVCSLGSGVPLFNGRLIPGAPWTGWSRVVPEDGYLDLPPAYRVEKR